MAILVKGRAVRTESRRSKEPPTIQKMGSDLGPVSGGTGKARDLARDETIDFHVVNMIRLREIPSSGFDVIVAFDNACLI